MGTKQIDAFAAHAKDAEWIKDGLRPYFRYGTWASRTPRRAG